jgi:hypothetical protein
MYWKLKLFMQKGLLNGSETRPYNLAANIHAILRIHIEKGRVSWVAPGGDGSVEAACPHGTVKAAIGEGPSTCWEDQTAMSNDESIGLLCYLPGSVPSPSLS